MKPEEGSGPLGGGLQAAVSGLTWALGPALRLLERKDRPLTAEQLSNSTRHLRASSQQIVPGSPWRKHARWEHCDTDALCGWKDFIKEKYFRSFKPEFSWHFQILELLKGYVCQINNKEGDWRWHVSSDKNSMASLQGMMRLNLEHTCL